MQPVQFRTTATPSQLVPCRVEAVLSEPVQDIKDVSTISDALRTGRQWAGHVNQILTNLQPHVAAAIQQDEQPTDLHPHRPGSVATSLGDVNVIAEFTTKQGRPEVTHLEIASESGDLRFSYQPNGLIQLQSHNIDADTSFSTNNGSIDPESIHDQLRRYEVMEGYSRALAREMSKPDWENSESYQHWLYNG